MRNLMEKVQEVSASALRATLPYIYLALVISVAFACNSDQPQQPNYRTQSIAQGSEEDQKALWLVLPDREDLFSNNPEIKEILNGYLISVWPKGQCASQGFVAFGAYEDNKRITINLPDVCTYYISMEIGHRAVNGSTPEPVEDEIIEGLSFTDVKPIIDQFCVSCHSVNGSRPNSDLSTYEEVLVYADDIKERVLSGSMPPGVPLSDENSSLIAGWVDQGSNPASLELAQDNVVLDSIFYRYEQGEIARSAINSNNSIQLNIDLWILPEGESHDLEIERIAI